VRLQDPIGLVQYFADLLFAQVLQKVARKDCVDAALRKGEPYGDIQPEIFAAEEVPINVYKAWIGDIMVTTP
jgi:hypothetical protein